MSRVRYQQPTCYMCNNNATGKEHVPPQCFFPKKKDLPPGLNYRSGLWRVPSCDQHNTKKSKEDQYLQIIIISNYGNNLAAQRDASKRTMRAIKRRLSLLGIMKNLRPVVIDGQQTGMFEVDVSRFNKAILMVARAVYYHEYGDKLLEDVKGIVLTPSILNPKDETYNRVAAGISKDAGLILDKSKIPEKFVRREIFYYQIHREEEDKRKAFIRMVFYEGCVINVGFDPQY